MRPYLHRASALLLSLLPLTACGTSPQVIEAPRLQVPASLLTCPDQPEPPALMRNDSDLAYWITDLAAAGQACRDSLASVRGLVAP